MQYNITLNENQPAFFNALVDYDIVVDSGTWRSGKSFELCLFFIERMKKYPGIREFLGRKTLKSLRETTFLKFQELLADFYELKEDIDYSVNRSSLIITFPNGSTCIFGDLDIHTIGKWLSSEYSDIGVDEGQEIVKIVFEKIKSRQTQTIIEKLSKGKQKNKFVMGMNPPEIAEFHWTHDKFRNELTKIKNSKMIYSHIEGNKNNIPTDYIDDMYSSIDSRTAEIYLRGNWVPLLSETVYPDYEFPIEAGEYVEGGNLKHLKVDPRLESYISIDFGWVHPMSIGCWQWDRERDIFYRLYEVVEPYVKPEKYCDLLMGKEVFHNGKTYKLPITSKNSTIIPLIEAIQRRQESDGASNLLRMKQIYEDCKETINYRLSNVGIYKGILAVRNHIKTSTGQRKLFIDLRYNNRFIRDCCTYHYPTDTSGNVTSEIPEKDNISDHTQDETRGLIGLLSPIRSQEGWRTS